MGKNLLCRPPRRLRLRRRMSRPHKRSRDDMDVEELTDLAEAFGLMAVSSLRALFTELVVGDLPDGIRNVDDVIDVLLNIRSVDADLEGATSDYNFCIEYARDFPDDDPTRCTLGLARLNRSKRTHSMARGRLVQRFHDLMEAKNNK